MVLAMMVLAGCSATPLAAQTANPPASVATLPPTAAPVSEATTVIVAEDQAALVLSPTPDNRLKPEQWQEWPVAPEQISGSLRDIYLKGQELGNDPGHFSRVGDCQSIREALLGMFEKGKPYRLSGDDKGLQETIDALAGSFERDGQAVQGGYNAASVLSPLWANPDVCSPGETPLDCELRVYKPSYVVISLEISFPGRTTEAYEKYMRRIIDRAIEKGAIPILVTKADNVEGDHSINLATARLAYEYDIPLVNWWLDAQGMPNQGMDPARDDGFHISMEAWTERSLQVLKTLDRTRRAVTGEPAVAGVQPTAAVLPTEAALEVLAVPEAGQMIQPATSVTGQVVFGLASRIGDKESPLGVYRLDLQSGNKSQILGEGYNLQAVSPDGSLLLVNKGAELYLTASDGSNPSLLARGFYDDGRQGALWQPGGQALVFIAREGQHNLLVYYPLDGSGWQKLTTAADDPRELYRSPVNGAYLFLDANGQAKRVSAPGLPGEALAEINKLVYSPDGKYLAYTVSRKDDKSGLVIAATDGSRETPLENIGDHIIDYAWSPDGAGLAVLTLMQSEYSGQWYDLRNMVITPADMGTRLLPAVSGLNARVAWAPDGSGLLFTSTVEKDGQYSVTVNRYEFSTGLMTGLTEQIGLENANFLLMTNMDWK